jgi:Ca-activated chloride channel family protein
MKALALLSVCALAGPAAAATTEGRLVTRDHGKPVDMPLEHTDVHIRVDGFLADATVTQRFANPLTTKIEAVYLFPLPTNAAVTDMTIRIGTRTIHGSIQERGAAKRVYEAARDKGLVAALLTEERPDLFTQNIANLEPGATIEVTLHYTERLAYESGGYELVFPMVAGPRASGDKPAPAAAPETRPARDIGLDIEIDAGVPITAVRSPSHRVTIDRLRTPCGSAARPGEAGACDRPADRRAHVRIADDDAVPNKDFVLRYDVAGTVPQLGALAYKDGDTGSFVLIAQPPADTAPVAIAPREIVFVLDTSSSMRGAPLDKAKQLIRDVLQTLRADDTFQIVRFDDRASALGPGPIANKPRNIQLVLDWLAQLDAGGGTEMTSGIDAALAVPHDPARLRIVAFLTDGYVGNEDAILAKIAAHAGESRLFGFGVGSAVNRYLLEEMAAQGRGVAQFVRPDEDTATVVRAFERRISAPVLTDVRIDWAGLAVTDVSPGAVPDLFLGQPLVVTGHYTRAGSATITVHGRQDGREVSFAVAVELPDRDPARPAIATVWARQRIAELSRQLVRKDDPTLVRAITQLSLAHHLLSPYTAFVAVDDSRVTKGGAATRVAVPVDVPDAVAGIAPAAGSGYGYGGGVFYGVGYGGGGGVAYGTGIGYGSIGTVGYGAGSSGLRGRTAAMPDVVFATPTVVGDIDAAIIRRYVKRNLEKIRYCYEKKLATQHDLQGTITAVFAISPSGVVASSTADGMDTEVAQCVADVIKQIEFPSHEGGGITEIHYPFNFKPAEETKP